MTIHQAQKILDSLKEGKDYPKFIIDRALRLTGDLDD